MIPHRAADPKNANGPLGMLRREGTGGNPHVLIQSGLAATLYMNGPKAKPI